MWTMFTYWYSYDYAVTTPDTWRLPAWTLLSNHGHVLLAIARDPQARLRDVAARVGITERAAHTIVTDLEAAGYLTRHRVGRRNEYTVDPQVPFRHPAERDHLVGELLALFTAGSPTAERPDTGSPAGDPAPPAGDPVPPQHPGTVHRATAPAQRPDSTPAQRPVDAERPGGPQSRNGGPFAPAPHPAPGVDCRQVRLKE